MSGQTMDGNTDTPCACCGRTHRKLRLTDNGWLGASCQEHVKLYRRNPSPKSIVWLGWERQFKKVDDMMRRA